MFLVPFGFCSVVAVGADSKGLSLCLCVCLRLSRTTSFARTIVSSFVCTISTATKRDRSDAKTQRKMDRNASGRQKLRSGKSKTFSLIKSLLRHTRQRSRRRRRRGSAKKALGKNTIASLPSDLLGLRRPIDCGFCGFFVLSRCLLANGLVGRRRGRDESISQPWSALPAPVATPNSVRSRPSYRVAAAAGRSYARRPVSYRAPDQLEECVAGSVARTSQWIRALLWLPERRKRTHSSEPKPNRTGAGSYSLACTRTRPESTPAPPLATLA